MVGEGGGSRKQSRAFFELFSPSAQLVSESGSLLRDALDLSTSVNI